MTTPRGFWVTGATNGLGMALANRLLEDGNRVAASVKDADSLSNLGQRYGSRLLPLPGSLQQMQSATDAAGEIAARWGSLDTLIINAGTCDYLPEDLHGSELLAAIATTNRSASEYSLTSALPLLAKGRAPQVLVILNHHSARQISDLDQPAAAGNDLRQWIREQRNALTKQGISLTLVAPQSLDAFARSTKTEPMEWTPDIAAQKLLEYLPQRRDELVLEAMSVNSLWPLPG